MEPCMSDSTILQKCDLLGITWKSFHCESSLVLIFSKIELKRHNSLYIPGGKVMEGCCEGSLYHDVEIIQ